MCGDGEPRELNLWRLFDTTLKVATISHAVEVALDGKNLGRATGVDVKTVTPVSQTSSGERDRPSW
jgi:hypothetical protein